MVPHSRELSLQTHIVRGAISKQGQDHHESHQIHVKISNSQLMAAFLKSREKV
jgi:hypothetical protein